MAEPIEMPFGLWTRVHPRNYVFDGVQIPSCEGTILTGGGKGWPIVKYRDYHPPVVAIWLFVRLLVVYISTIIVVDIVLPLKLMHMHTLRRRQ